MMFHCVLYDVLMLFQADKKLQNACSRSASLALNLNITRSVRTLDIQDAGLLK